MKLGMRYIPYPNQKITQASRCFFFVAHMAAISPISTHLELVQGALPSMPWGLHRGPQIQQANSYNQRWNHTFLNVLPTNPFGFFSGEIQKLALILVSEISMVLFFRDPVFLQQKTKRRLDSNSQDWTTKVCFWSAQNGDRITGFYFTKILING